MTDPYASGNFDVSPCGEIARLKVENTMLRLEVDRLRSNEIEIHRMLAGYRDGIRDFPTHAELLTAMGM